MSANQTESKGLKDIAQLRHDLCKRIMRERLEPWLSEPPEQFVGPFRVKVVSLRSLADLEYAGNEFIFNAVFSPDADVLAYVWRHLHKPVRFKRYCRGALKFGLEEFRAQACEHLTKALAEPPVPSRFGRTVKDYRLPPVPVLAGLTEELAAASSVSPDVIADWPVAKVFQLLRAHRIRVHGLQFGDHPDLVALKSAYLKSLDHGKN